MNKKKKIISLLTAIPFAASTVALAISCNSSNSDDDNGDISVNLDQGTEQSRITNASLGANPKAVSKRFDQTNVKSVRLAVTFSTSNYQWKGLEQIINAYNATQSKTTGFLPVQLVNAGSGYGGGAASVSSALASKNYDNFYNLILNYGNVAAQLAEYDMLLSFNSTVENQNTDISNFSPAFTDNNQTIQNVENNSSYLLPFSKSTNVSYYDGIVMFYIINAFKDNKALDMTDPDTSAWYNKLKKIKGNNNGEAITSGENENDLGYVKTLWGDVVANASTILKDYIKKPLKLSDLENYKGLLTFAETAQQLFKNSSASDSTLHILGIDDPTSALEIAVFQQNNGNYRNSLESISKSNSGGIEVNYDGLNKSNSPIQNAARTAFDAFYNAYKGNALVLQEPGAYTSTDLVYHKYAFAIGSTAGYSHDFIGDLAGKYKYVAPKDLDSFSFSAVFNNGTNLKQPNYIYFNFNTPKQGATDQVGVFSSKFNPIYKYSSYKFDNASGKYEKDVNTATMSEYGLITNSENDTTLLTNATTTNLAALQAGNAALVILPQRTSDSAQLSTMIKDIKNFANTPSNNTIYAGTLASAKNPSVKYVAFVIKGLENPVKYTNKKNNNTYFYPNGNSVQPIFNNLWKSINGSLEQTKDYNSLGEKELQIMYAPTTWDGNGDVNYAFLQGPSLIGIHANPVGDKATRLFVHWLITQGGNIENPKYDKDKEKDKDNQQYLLNGLSPIKFMETNMSYISPIAGFEDVKNPNYLDPQTFSNGQYANPMLTLAAKMFEDAALYAKDSSAKVTKWKLYESPAGTKSSSFRDAVAAAFKSMQKTNYSFDTFAKAVQSSFSDSSSK